MYKLGDIAQFLAPLIYEGGCPEGAGGSPNHNE